jgi:adenylate cyclase
MSATEFSALLNRFYRVSTDVLIAQGAWLDKLVGDEVVAFFLPAMTGHGGNHASSALAAARAMLGAFGYGSPAGPWVPVGIGVHAGSAFVGTVGTGALTDLTALGDDVNVASRLASAAPAGTIVVSEATFLAAGVLPEGSDRRELDLKGKSSTIPVRFLSA